MECVICGVRVTRNSNLVMIDGQPTCGHRACIKSADESFESTRRERMNAALRQVRASNPEFRASELLVLIEGTRRRSLSSKLSSSIIVSGKASLIFFCKDCGDVGMKVSNQVRCMSCSSKHAALDGRRNLRWSSAVKSRDGWKCRICGSTHELEAHHVIPASRNPLLIGELSNGITLCANHHRLDASSVHRILGVTGSPKDFWIWFESVKAAIKQPTLDDF